MPGANTAQLLFDLPLQKMKAKQKQNWSKEWFMIPSEEHHMATLLLGLWDWQLSRSLQASSPAAWRCWVSGPTLSAWYPLSWYNYQLCSLLFSNLPQFHFMFNCSSDLWKKLSQLFYFLDITLIRKLKIKFKKKAKEMGRCLKALAALSEDLSPVPSTYMVSHDLL